MRKSSARYWDLYTPCALLSSAEHSKIVVIAAGFARLTAAYRLHQQGMHFKVYEERNIFVSFQ